ncbi:hypothetical protein FOZ61_003874 [Perkinsus olseni]|nr:hypothetical protein FOZ61_003874 [Perkinsus olseni]
MVARQECRQNALSAHGCYLYLCRCLGQGPKLKLMDHLERALPPEAFMSNYELMFTTALEFLQAHFATTNDHDRITRHLSAIKMASKSVSVHDYLDTLESSISMANSVGLYLHASQVLDYFKRGLTPHLRKVCNQQYSNIRDVTELAMALQYYQEANPPPTTAITTPTATTTSTTTSNSTTSTSSVAPIQSTNPTTTRLQRIEDPEVIKLCKEKRICMAYLARQSCKNGDSCPYKHTTEVSRMTAPTTPTTTPNADSVTILNCPACEGFTIVPDTGSTMSLISKKLADFIVKTVEGAQLLSFHATFDSATEAKSFSCDYCLQVDLPVYDGNATHILPWRPAVLQTPLIHSDALLGMDALRFDRQGLLLRFKDGEDALASLFFRSVPPQISTGSVPSSLSPVTCELPRSNSAASPSETSHSPIPTTSTTPLPTASVAPPCELLPPASTTAPNNAVKIKRKGDVDYNVKEALTTPPTFPPLDDGFVIDQHVYSNQWCRILTIKDEDNNKQFMVDYSNELLQLALQNQPPEATKVHYRLLKSDGRVRREAEARFDDLLNTNKVVATPAHSVNNYASPWYPVEGRKRCRPVVPSICSNQLLRQVQRHYPIRDCQSKISRILNKYRSAKTASLLDVKDSYRSIRLGKNAQLLSQVHVRGSTLTYLYMLDGSSINAKVLEWCVNHLHG